MKTIRPSLLNSWLITAIALVDLLPFGWRALYFAGVVPLLVIAHLRRHMPETRRFLAGPGVENANLQD